MRALAHNHIYSVSGMVAETSALKARQLLPHLNLTCTLKQQNKHTDLKYRVNQKNKTGKLDKFERLCDSDKGRPSSKPTNPPHDSIHLFWPNRDLCVPQ